MTDLALQIAGSKLAISIVLGAAVWLVARGNERPRLCHALCLTLLAALLVPPLIGVPVLQPEPSVPIPADIVSRDATHPFAMAIDDPRSGVPRGAVDGGWFAAYRGLGFVLLWLVGAVVVLGWTIVRTQRFRRSLRGASREAPAQLQRMARDIAHTLGLKKVPTIRMTYALVSPMVWWGGATVHVLVPSTLLDGLEQAELRCIIAHELAHVRRRDHVVRWLEWVACTVFWWNPVAWWARRQLRAAGEVCSDALAVSALDCVPRDYARALVRAIDRLRTERAPRLPAFASAADNGRRTRPLERRLRMIITNEPASTPSQAFRLALRGGLVASLVLGLVYCSEPTSPTATELPAATLTDAPRQVVKTPPVRSEAEKASWNWLVAGGPNDLPLMRISGNAPLPTPEEQERLLAELAKTPTPPEGSSRYQVFFDVSFEENGIVEFARKFDIVYLKSAPEGLGLNMLVGPQTADPTDALTGR